MCSLGLFPPHRLRQKRFQETRGVFFGVCWILVQQSASPVSSLSSHHRLKIARLDVAHGAEPDRGIDLVMRRRFKGDLFHRHHGSFANDSHETGIVGLIEPSELG